MAVESKGGSTTNGANGAVPSGAASTNGANGATGLSAGGTGANAAVPRRKRSSSLMKNASSLPTVEHSLEEFIAKANQTLVDVSGWGEDNKQVDPVRKEADAARWKQAEHQMRDSEVREQSLRRQLDGLQGKLAEAEARAAVAGTQMGSAAHDTTISDLKSQIDKAIQRMRSAEDRSQELQQALASVKAESSAKISRPSLNGIDEDDAAERIRLAEAKATKAIAAARAAQAGLTVSSADLAAIESGLLVIDAPTKKSPWPLVAVAFIGGLAIMFAVWKLVLDKPAKAPATPAAAATSTQPAASSASAGPAISAEPVEPAKPVVTPIEDKPAATEEAKAAAAPVVTPIEDKPAAAPVEAAKPAPVEAAKPAPVEAAKPAPVETKPKAEPKATRKAAAKPARPAKKPTARATIADPFAETPAPKKPAKPADKKPAGTIVDPF